MENSKGFPKEFRFSCVDCGNCCTNAQTVVNVTYSDILRIKKGMNLSLEEVLEILGFYVFGKKPSTEELKKMVVPPIETEKGLAFTGLKKKEGGTCYFYDEKEKRCLIYNLRPNFCRTFPFSFKILFDKQDATKAKIKLFYTEKGKKYCKGISTDAPLIDENEWIKVGKSTIEDMHNNNIFIQKWNEATNKKQILPSVRNYLITVFNLDKAEQKD